jgi:hypothetical protein
VLRPVTREVGIPLRTRAPGVLSFSIAAEEPIGPSPQMGSALNPLEPAPERTGVVQKHAAFLAQRREGALMAGHPPARGGTTSTTPYSPLPVMGSMYGTLAARAINI